MNNMNKKILIVLFPLFLSFNTLISCGGGKGPTPTPTPIVRLLEIYATAKKHLYAVDNIFTADDIEVEAYYSDSSQKKITEGYAITPALPYTFNNEDIEAGVDFTITYQDKSANIHVNVRAAGPDYLDYLEFNCVDEKVVVKATVDPVFPKTGIIEIPTVVDKKYIKNGSSLSEGTHNVTKIAERAFYLKTEITSVTIPNTITAIESDAFYGCTSLKTFTIPSDIALIALENNAFMWCTHLAAISLPKSLNSVGVYCFNHCQALTNIEFNGKLADWEKVTKEKDWHNDTPATYVKCSDGDAPLN